MLSPTTEPKKVLTTNSFKYLVVGILFGLIFPILALMLTQDQLIWVIFTAPFVLGIVFFILGIKLDINEDLNQSRDLLQQLFESSPYPTFYFDERGIIDCNLATIKILRANDKSQILNKQLIDFSPKFQLDGLPSKLKAMDMDLLAKKDNIHRYEWSCRTFEGKDILVEASQKLVHLGKGTGFLVQWKDLTEEKQSGLILAEALRKVEFYRSAIDQVAIVTVTDPAGNIIFSNEKMSEISKYTRDELVGNNHRILNSGHHPKDFFKNMWKTILSGNTWRGDVCNRAKDGSIYWVDSLIVPHKNASGKIIQLVSIRYDITAKKMAKEKIWSITENRRAILESANYSIISTDQNGVILSFNKAAERMLGYQASEVIGNKTITSLHDQEEIEARAAILSYEMGQTVEAGLEALTVGAKLENKSSENEWTYTRKDNSKLPVKSSVSCLYAENGNLIGYLEIAEDITERKKFHDELIKANQEAINSLKIKREFLANMSHEIRTPMNGVIGMCNLLLEECNEKSQVEKLKIIQNCGNTLLDLINDILDFSKLEAGRVELENNPFPIEKTILEVVDLLNSKASEKGLTLSYDRSGFDLDWINSDVTRFRQILMNLIGNAIKFTSEGKISIQCSYKELADKKILVYCSVVDTGVGISEAAQAKLFASFSQVDASTTRQFGGSGLGLAICKGLSEMMGGTISVESKIGEGSNFTFSFIAEKAMKQAVIQDQKPFESFKDLKFESLKILIAEDNRVNQQVICGLLKKLGCHADVAANGNEVLSQLKHKGYDLIFMDCHMPEKDGFETTRIICQKYNEDQKPRIVALTASTMKQDVEKCYASGMDGFLSKPIKIQSLVEVLSECLEILKSKKTA